MFRRPPTLHSAFGSYSHISHPRYGFGTHIPNQPAYLTTKVNSNIFYAPIRLLAKNIRDFTHTFDTKRFLEKLNTLYNDNDLKPLFDLSAYNSISECHSKIRVHVHRQYYAGKIPVCGAYDLVNCTIHLATEDLQCDSELTGTFLHELSHHVEKLLNQNGCRPYKVGESIVAISKASRSTLLGFSKIKGITIDKSKSTHEIGKLLAGRHDFQPQDNRQRVDDIISKILSTYADYPESEEHTEIAVKYAQLLGSEVPKQTLEKHIAPLVRYHRQITLPKIDFFIAKLAKRLQEDAQIAIRKYLKIENCLLHKLNEDKYQLIFAENPSPKKLEHYRDLLKSANLDAQVEKKTGPQSSLFNYPATLCIHDPITVIAANIVELAPRPKNCSI